MKRIPWGLAVLFAFQPFSVFAGDDACEFVRQQIRELPESGGEIAIPAGHYDCTAPLILNRNHVTLKGAGEGQTVLRLADNVHAPLLIIGSPRTIVNSNGEFVVEKRVEDITVSDLTLDGNRDHHDPAKECGEHSCDGDPSSVRNNGISIRGATDIRVRNVTAHSTISGGMVTEKHCRRLRVENFTSYNNYFDGFAGYETEDSDFIGMNLHHNRGAGISIDINFNNNRVLNSRLHDNGDVGIFARDLHGNLFERLDIQRSGNHGIFLANSGEDRTCARENEFRTITVQGSKGAGFWLNNDCAGNRITKSSNLCDNRGGPFGEAIRGQLGIDPDVLCGTR